MGLGGTQKDHFTFLLHTFLWTEELNQVSWMGRMGREGGQGSPGCLQLKVL